MPAAPRLHELQQGFAAAVLGHGDDVAAWIDGAGLDPAARLRIYRNAVAATLEAALHDTFPTVHALVGEDFFDAMAARYRQRHPSTCGNLQSFGGALPGFIEAMPQARSLGYLADIARLDWLRQLTVLAPDATPADAHAAADAAAVEPRQLHLRLHPSLHLLHSRWAVLTLWRWCQSPVGPAPRPDRGGESVLLWRDGGEVVMAAVDPATFRCIDVLAAGGDVAAAHRAAMDLDAAFDLQPCLRDLLVQGLVVAFNNQEGCT
ncbi:DUF2063 domain-containing protein [Rhodanobacter thiooxydans]|uniref:DUF2063 domain-containing protein n=1 Tax=Rhodanobacter thiooxydans TaxID=416169 RepID=A0A154QFZ1_9GAMM|nr:DNA-binding domain-containing protein [Rhodanobacter thiooxydans]EIL99263.1 hypothetical protein UUA_09656 [Rhodanobacter thiooxydans LCS2]KZC22710.1 DUF2063 domain-containing protein [Rhodanobacter thiooxydans]MCW0202083.1 putative DNA-binding domain-containing protein [Rhodanobacter thiooxydans]